MSSGSILLLEAGVRLMERSEELVFERPGFGKAVFRNGFSVPGPSETFKDKASIQPLTGKDLLRLEEGDRRRQHVWIYTRAELRVGDVVTRKKEKFEVQTVEDWGPFRKARAVLEDVERI